MGTIILQSYRIVFGLDKCSLDIVRYIMIDEVTQLCENIWESAFSC